MFAMWEKCGRKARQPQPPRQRELGKLFIKTIAQKDTIFKKKEEKAREIKRLLENGYTKTQIAKKLCMSRPNLYITYGYLFKKPVRAGGEAPIRWPFEQPFP